MVTYRGRWRVSVIGKDSAWPQRVVVTTAAGTTVLPGAIGQSREVDGDTWTLNIEHDDGSGWSSNEVVAPDPMAEAGLHMSQVVRSKDALRPGDTDPNDLVVRVDKVGPAIELTSRPFAADAATLTMLADGVFANLQGLQLMGVVVRNTWGRSWGQGEFALAISPLSRATLATFGVVVEDSWPVQVLAATQQQLLGSAVTLPAVEVGSSHLVFFAVDTSAAHRGKPDVELVLTSSGPAPDPSNPMRYARRQVYVAEVGYDSSTGTASVQVPEGTLTLRIDAMVVDLRSLKEMCADVRAKLRASDDPATRRLLKRMQTSPHDDKTCRDLFALVCRCLSTGEDGSSRPGDKGWGRVCGPEGLWLPLRFEYAVEINGGFEGQHGPLAFEDPWWKVALLILAVLAWLVGLIASIVADKTGWGNQGDFPRTIGTVGQSDRATTDACIIEFDGSRPALQAVADAIPGETNGSAIASAGTVVPIDPRVALPSLASADVVGRLVYKSGARTGLTHGVISSIGPFTQCRGDFDDSTSTCTPDPAHPDLVLPGQFRIAADPAFGEELFDDHGDSGSIVLSRDPATPNQVVGLLHSGSGGTSPIQDVLAALNLTLN
jgi:hypothetical protein